MTNRISTYAAPLFLLATIFLTINAVSDRHGVWLTVLLAASAAVCAHLTVEATTAAALRRAPERARHVRERGQKLIDGDRR